MPPFDNNRGWMGGASITDILTALKDAVVAANGIQNRLSQQLPDNTSGTLTANTLVQTGFVRLLGISVTTAGVAGTLHDATSVAAAGAGNVAFSVPATVGYTTVNAPFANGLVYKPGAGQVATLFYSRT